MNADIVKSGLSLVNYLQSALTPEAPSHGDVPSDFEPPSDRSQQLPAVVRPIIDSGRVYFRLTHQHALNNLLCVFVPVGKVRHLVPDLYIPAVSITTFLLLRSVYICLCDGGHPVFNDVLARTLTRIGLVCVSEFLLLTALLYATAPSGTLLDDIPGPGLSRTPSVQLGPPVPLGGSGDGFGGSGGRAPGAASDPFSQAAGGGSAVQPPGVFPSSVGPFGSHDAPPSHYGPSGAMVGSPFGQRSPVLGSVSAAGGPQLEASSKYFDDYMNLPLCGRPTLRLGEKLLVIGYKYVLLNCYVLTVLALPVRGVIILLSLYIIACSLLFSLRTIVSLKVGDDRKSNPIMFIFPVLQPVFCYFLLPHI
ncbi:uncharacterized protein BcabD6B2_29760 [Babesia caballi]|uniref:Integral membrane protein n=1 Tax=Babesia caballi TaxID=5871 RepID=A0AAV4LTP1_BABCB|nr:integral membrane protein [Babesia caballi]